VRPTRRIPGLPSDRAWVDENGILLADVCLIPLEDGDRTEALQRLGKRVIAIDLNPLSRTAQRADLTIVDELTRALRNIREAIESGQGARRVPKWDPPNAQFLREALRAIQDELTRRSAASTPTPSRRGRAGARPR
jgi:4-phosphopantoate--beta-alanine ligase